MGQCNRRINMKIEFSFQRRETLLFLTPNMAAVTSVQTSNIDSWRFHEIGKLRKWGMGTKNANEATKRGILSNGDYNQKMANLGEKGKFRQK